MPRSATAAGADTLDALDRALFRVARTASALRVDAYAQGAPCDRAGLAILSSLSSLEHGERPRLSDLALALGLDLSTVSRQIRVLEEATLVVREGDPEDGRASRFAVTDRGRSVLHEVRSKRRGILGRALSSWTSADRAALSNLLQRLAEDLGPDPCSPLIRKETP